MNDDLWRELRSASLVPVKVSFAIPHPANEPSFSPDQTGESRDELQHDTEEGWRGVFVALRFTIQMGNTTHTLEVEAVVRSMRQNIPPQTPSGRSRSE